MTAFVSPQGALPGASHLVEQWDGGGPTGCDVHAGRARDLLEMVMPTAGGATREHSPVNGHGDKARQQCHLVVAGHGADCVEPAFGGDRCEAGRHPFLDGANVARRSEEHTSELQSLMRIPSALLCLNKNTK